MPAAWRLAINSLSARRSRSALLATVVALSAALIATVACAMATVHRAIDRQIGATIGAAEVRLKPAGSGKTLPASMLATVRAWPEVRAAAGSLQEVISLSLRRPVMEPGPGGGFVEREAKFSASAAAESTPESGQTLIPPPTLVVGRLPEAPGEIVVDAALAARLAWRDSARARDGFSMLRAEPYRAPDRARAPREIANAEDAARFNRVQRVAIGDELEVQRQLLPLGSPLSLPGLLSVAKVTVVGIAEQPPLGGRPRCYMTLEGLSAIADKPAALSQIDISVNPGVEPAAVVAAHRAEVGADLLLETTSLITSGLDQNVKSSQLGFVLACVMAFLSAAFIITTGLTTGVTERQRELAILRCIGAGKGQLVRAQLLVGLILGGAGAVVGVPLGIGFAALMAWVFRDQLPSGGTGALALPVSGLALAAFGALVSGVVGAAWPAWSAGRTTPMGAMAARAAPARARGLVFVTVVALACLALEMAVVFWPRDGQVAFWLYAPIGLPAMFFGYFLLGVPVTLVVTRLLSVPLSRGLGLPPRVLARTVAATPYRHGLTAGALMGGLALMVAIWTHGGAILRDWIDRIEFPDAFVSGLSLTPESQARLDAMPFVKATSAVTLHPVETDVFGVRALQKYKTMFVAFEPESFLKMTRLTWVQGDPAEATRRLEQGGAVIVAREFLIAQGMGVGRTFKAKQDGREYEFEIVGVVASPGLEMVSKFFNIGEDYTDQALHAVFGSRKDLKEKFHSDAIHLIQIDLAEGVDDETALATIRTELFGAGILDAGSGRQVKAEIRSLTSGMLLVTSAIAVVAMLVASCGVANLIAAGVEARRFEFGVLRAVGSTRGLLSRLVAAEAVLIGLSAAVLGTGMGIQGSAAGQRLDAMLMGIQWDLRPPIGPIAIAWAFVVLLAVGAAWPSIRRLAKTPPRELLAAMRG